MIGMLITIALGIAIAALIFFVLYRTYFALGTFGVFSGGKTRFSGVADATCNKDKVMYENCRNLNGTTIKTLRIHKDTSYTINCDVKSDKGNVKIKLKDGKNNIIMEETNSSSIKYESNENQKIFVCLEFDKFYGDIKCIIS